MGYRRYMFMGLLMGMGLAAYAQDSQLAPDGQEVQLLLDSLSVQQVSERSVDELYLSIAVYPSQETPYHFRVPPFPSYWLSTHIHQIDDLVLWKYTLADNKSALLIISLLEHDTPPWDNDDLIGVAKLKIKNNKGTLEYQWLTPGIEVTETHRLHKDSQPEGHSKLFTLQGDQSHYQMALKLTMRLSKEVKKSITS